MTLEKKLQFVFAPLHLSHTARPQLQAAEHWFHKSYVPETFIHSFFPKSHFSERKSGQNLNVKFPGRFYGANTELSAPIIQPPIFFYLFWMEWIVWYLNNAAAGPNLTPLSPENLLLGSCRIAFDCQRNCFGNCSFLFIDKIHCYKKEKILLGTHTWESPVLTSSIVIVTDFNWVYLVHMFWLQSLEGLFWKGVRIQSELEPLIKTLHLLFKQMHKLGKAKLQESSRSNISI